MRVAYFDCFSGASGDMILAACVHAGLALDTLREDLRALDVGGFTIDARPILKQGFAATCFEVTLARSEEQNRRHLKHICDIIDGSRLPQRVREKALAVFNRLAEAEAVVHATTVEKVHFHEVGAIDAIVDIVGTCIAIDHLGIERVCCSPIPAGSGTVRCEHGLMPVPAPATAELLKGIPLAPCDEEGELTTPTAAAILTTLADSFGPPPAMIIEKIGVGAGRREGQNRPNIMRILIGELIEQPTRNGSCDEYDEVVVLQANLDDISGEVIGHMYDRLFTTGALDVFTTPIYMKKNRPATQLTVLAPPARREAIEEIIFAETTTFGIRGYLARRRKLSRSFETVETDFGPIRIKVGRRGQRVITASPEYEDCREAANQTGRPLIDLMEIALRTWRTSARHNDST